jgi:RNA polymerase sigma-70 factor (ECF subfamily)
VSSSTTRFIPVLGLAPTEQVRQQERTSKCVELEGGESPRPGVIADVSEDSSVPSDEQLISYICAGDKEALALLFRRYARLVRSVAYKVLRDPFEAEDLLQEIFLLVSRKSAAFDSSKAPARFWILRMTYHRAISRRRYLEYRQFYTGIELDIAERTVRDPRLDADRLNSSIDATLGRSDVQKLLGMLSENQRKTLTLHFFEGYNFDEIAAELGQSRDNVRHHYFRGLDKLRKQIFPEHFSR